MDTLTQFLQIQGIPYSTPESTDFSSLQSSYSGTHETTQPSITVLPNSATDIAKTVKQCIASKLPIIVRGAGHDVFGRFTASNAVSIDLRNVNTVHMSTDEDNGDKTACIGGGATAAQVLEALAKQGFQVPVGACGEVGFTSWALVGGFGPFMNSHGLGADQIVGAKVVNAKRDLVNADARLLKGLRGGGGCLAIVAELIVKVYPLRDVSEKKYPYIIPSAAPHIAQIQAGTILFDSSDLNTAAATLFTNLNTLLTVDQDFPDIFHVMPGLVPIPGLGTTLICLIIWNGPASEESKKWVDRIAGLAPLMPGGPDPQMAIENTSVLAFVNLVTNILARRVSGKLHVASLTNFSLNASTTLGRLMAKFPERSIGGINIHILRSDSPSCSSNIPDSVCPYREPQILVELLGYGSDEATAAEASAWALEARNELMSLNESRSNTYLPFTAPEFLCLEDTYGDQLVELMKIKREYDPENFFKNTIPKLDS